jgi:uncharacterized protein
LCGVDRIIHAGDIGSPEVLTELHRIAPVHAVRGNVIPDIGQRTKRYTGHWAKNFPEISVVEVGELSFYVLHNISALDIDPRAAGFAAVIFGHSHLPTQQLRDGVLCFNPGSAGPNRFRLPVALGIITISDGSISSEIINLG